MKSETRVGASLIVITGTASALAQDGAIVNYRECYILEARNCQVWEVEDGERE